MEAVRLHPPLASQSSPSTPSSAAPTPTPAPTKTAAKPTSKSPPISPTTQTSRAPTRAVISALGTRRPKKNARQRKTSRTNQAKRKGQITSPSIFHEYPEIAAAAAAIAANGGSVKGEGDDLFRRKSTSGASSLSSARGKPPLDPRGNYEYAQTHLKIQKQPQNFQEQRQKRKQKPEKDLVVRDPNASGGTKAMLNGVLRGESRSRRRMCLRRLITVAKKLGIMAGISLPSPLEKRLKESGDNSDISSRKNSDRQEGIDKEEGSRNSMIDRMEQEKNVDDTLELLCVHFEEIRDKMTLGSVISTVEKDERIIPRSHHKETTLESQTKGGRKKCVSFGKTVSINDGRGGRRDMSSSRHMNQGEDEFLGQRSFDRITSFGSDSIYEFVGEEEDAGDVDIHRHPSGLRPNSSLANGYAEHHHESNGILAREATLDEQHDMVDSDDDTLGPSPVIGEGDPSRPLRSVTGPHKMSTGRRPSNASSSRRRSTERPVGAGQRDIASMMPVEKPSFHLDFPASRMNSYMTNITSRNSIGPSPATIKEQQEQLHRDFMTIFGSNDDTVIPPKAPGASLIKVAGGELYTEEPLSRRWTLGAEIAKSENASVRVATRVLKEGERNHDGQPEQVAVKVISKLNSKLYNEAMTGRETFCFRLLGFEEMHENVVQLYEVCEDASNVYLVMEYLEGGELFARISEKGQYTEKDAANLVVAMLNGLKFCHRRNVVHRDIKPENFVFAKKPSKTNELVDIKLTDFSIAHYSEDPTVPCKTLIGTPLYMAPEILLQQGYGASADLWSLGIIVYIMLAGYAPFDDDDLEQLVKKIKYRTVKFDGPEWVLISEQGKQFITNLLDKDPSKRMTAEEALEHKWLQNNCHAATRNLLEVAQINIKSFVTKRRWKAAIYGVKAMNRMQKMARLARVVTKSNKDLSNTQVEAGYTAAAPLRRSPSLTRRMTTRRPPDSGSPKKIASDMAAANPLTPSLVETEKSVSSPPRREHREPSNLRGNSALPAHHYHDDETYESGSMHWNAQARRIREGRHQDARPAHDRNHQPLRDNNRPRTVQSIQVNNSSVVIRPPKHHTGLFRFCFR